MLLLSFEQSKRLIAKIGCKVHKRLGGLTDKQTGKTDKITKIPIHPMIYFVFLGMIKLKLVHM